MVSSLPKSDTVNAASNCFCSSDSTAPRHWWRALRAVWLEVLDQDSSVSSLPVHNREFGRLLEYLCVFMALHHVILLLAHTHSIAARIPCTFLRTTYPIVPFCQNRTPWIESASLHACILSFQGIECQVYQIGSLTPHGLL